MIHSEFRRDLVDLLGSFGLAQVLEARDWLSLLERQWVLRVIPISYNRFGAPKEMMQGGIKMIDMLQQQETTTASLHNRHTLKLNPKRWDRDKLYRFHFGLRRFLLRLPRGQYRNTRRVSHCLEDWPVLCRDCTCMDRGVQVCRSTRELQWRRRESWKKKRGRSTMKVCLTWTDRKR